MINVEKLIEEDTLIYLASLYTHKDARVRLWRHDTACRVAAKMFDNGLNVFSPIAHSHAIACYGQLPFGSVYWAKFNKRWLQACDELWILTLDGFETSNGIITEKKHAKDLNKRIAHVSVESPLDPIYEPSMEDEQNALG